MFLLASAPVDDDALSHFACERVTDCPASPPQNRLSAGDTYDENTDITDVDVPEPRFVVCMTKLVFAQSCWIVLTECQRWGQMKLL